MMLRLFRSQHFCYQILRVLLLLLGRVFSSRYAGTNLWYWRWSKWPGGGQDGASHRSWWQCWYWTWRHNRIYILDRIRCEWLVFFERFIRFFME